MPKNKKMKVAWICHFSNEKVREKLPLSKRIFLNRLKKLLGMQPYVYSDFAPWVNNLITEFEKFEEVELHIIAPHTGLKKKRFDFEMNGIHYHFFKSEDDNIYTSIINKLGLNKKPKYTKNRKQTAEIVTSIKPDIVNLIGTENPYYSITVLDIGDIPIFVSAQTVYTNPDRKKLSGSYDSLLWNTELKIHHKEKYYGCAGRMHRDLILRNNPDAIIFKNFFPIQYPKKVKEVEKEFDFVFFAQGVSQKKGIEDAIDALALVKKEKPDVTLIVVGSCPPNYKVFLNNKINNLKLTKNISFHDYFPIHSDMHQYIKKAKFALFPVKLDVIPGTVIEAILLELPVVTYKTTGTPYLNKDGETVLISEIGNIEHLAANMLQLLNSPELAEQLKKKAKAFVEKEFDNTASAKRLVEDYKAVIAHYHDGTPIPKELLFDLNEFPIY
jgi:glycosyltransferase involved in cell wall biosynthesis